MQARRWEPTPEALKQISRLDELHARGWWRHNPRARQALVDLVIALDRNSPWNLVGVSLFPRDNVPSGLQMEHHGSPGWELNITPAGEYVLYRFDEVRFVGPVTDVEEIVPEILDAQVGTVAA